MGQGAAGTSTSTGASDSTARPFWRASSAADSSETGTNRTRSLSRSRSALASLTAPMAFQLLPPSIVYSQLPLPFVSPVIATPNRVSV